MENAAFIKMCHTLEQEMLNFVIMCVQTLVDVFQLL